jgi:geranylgeranyl transferase type-1 subunit beta
VLAAVGLGGELARSSGYKVHKCFCLTPQIYLMGDTLDEPPFLKERHIKYWLRCAKTFLPEQYTSTDSARLSLAYFIVSALDLLNILDAKVTQEERDGWVRWIYHCQLPEGGFRGSTGTDFGDRRRTVRNLHWDPANLPSTFFAIVTLIVLGDDLSGIRRKECLDWLPKLQRENGSFGETLGENGTIEGGNDLRFCCCAAGIRYILRGKPGDQLANDAADLDVENLIRYVASCQVCRCRHRAMRLA